MSSEVIKYENVFFIRDNRNILNDINWEVKKGEHWAILGLNGSGKSSIINMLTAYECPTKGSVSVFGHRFGAYDWSKIKGRIGFVSNTLNKFLSTLNSQKVESIVLSGKFSSIGLYKDVNDDDRALADSLIKTFRLDYVRNNRYSTLSQGEQRLTLLSRAFMNIPELLVLDEPCSGLDIRARETLLNALEEQISKSDSTVLYITHNTEEIVPSITHVALIKDGEIIAKGPKKDILTEENLSNVYCVDISLKWYNERPWVVVK